MPLFIVPAGGAVPKLLRIIGGPVILKLVASSTAFGTAVRPIASVMPGNGRSNAMLGNWNAFPVPGAVAATTPLSERQPCRLANIVCVIAGVGTIVIVID